MLHGILETLKNGRKADGKRGDNIKGEGTGEIPSVIKSAGPVQADKLRGWIYSIHTGGFVESHQDNMVSRALLGASLPLTGYYIWIRHLIRGHNKLTSSVNCPRISRILEFEVGPHTKSFIHVLLVCSLNLTLLIAIGYLNAPRIDFGGIFVCGHAMDCSYMCPPIVSRAFCQRSSMEKLQSLILRFSPAFAVHKAP